VAVYPWRIFPSSSCPEVGEALLRAGLSLLGFHDDFIISAATPSSPTDFVQTGGIVGLVIFILITGYKKLWVFGWVYRERIERDASALREIAQEKDAWRDTALKSSKIATEAFDEMGRRGGSA
jgi:hypothetical protein